MTTADVFPAPVLPPSMPSDKWEAEFGAFQRLLPELLPVYRGQYVAIHNETVVGVGSDKFETARKAYAEFGPVAILVTLVTDEPQPVVRIISPRVGPERV